MLSVDPLLGVGGSNVKVVINVQPSQNAPIRSFRVTFGTVDATTRVAFENRASEIEHVELVATAPRLAGPIQTGRVSLLVQAVDAQEQVLATAEAGAFEYVDGVSQAILFPGVRETLKQVYQLHPLATLRPWSHKRVSQALANGMALL